MEAFLKLLWGWLTQAYDSFGELMVANLLWVVFTLLVVTAPPAAAGLYYVTNRLAHEERCGWRKFFEGFRAHFWVSWRWGLLNLFALVVFVSNYVFYDQINANWAIWAKGVFLGLSLIWLFLQIYTFPLLLEQTDQRLITALRNSLVIYIKRPGMTIGTSIVILALIIISTRYLIPAWFVITASLSAFLANQATIKLVKDLVATQSE